MKTAVLVAGLLATGAGAYLLYSNHKKSTTRKKRRSGRKIEIYEGRGRSRMVTT